MLTSCRVRVCSTSSTRCLRPNVITPKPTLPVLSRPTTRPWRASSAKSFQPRHEVLPAESKRALNGSRTGYDWDERQFNHERLEEPQKYAGQRMGNRRLSRSVAARSQRCPTPLPRSGSSLRATDRAPFGTHSSSETWVVVVGGPGRPRPNPKGTHSSVSQR